MNRSTGTDPESDTALRLGGHVTLTVLSPLEARPSPDHDPDVVTALR